MQNNRPHCNYFANNEMRRRKKFNSFHQYFPCVMVFIVFVRANMNECDVIMSIFQLSTIHFGVFLSICPKCGSASNRCSISVSTLTALHCVFVCVCFFHFDNKSTCTLFRIAVQPVHTYTLHKIVQMRFCGIYFGNGKQQQQI